MLSSAAAATAAFSLVASPGLALQNTMAEASILAEDESFFRDQMSRHGVTLETQDRLFERLESGQTWEADAADATPVTTEVRDDAGLTYRVETFSDGSISAVSIQQPSPPSTTHDPDQMTIMRWLGCGNIVVGSVYNQATDCGADWMRGTTYMKFFVDARIYHGGFGQITAVHTSSARHLQGGMSTSERVDREWETAGAPARASMTMIGNLIGPIGSKTHLLIIELRNGTFSDKADW